MIPYVINREKGEICEVNGQRLEGDEADMTGFKDRCIPYEMKANLIKIIDYREKNLRGILYNPFYESPQYFDNLAQCLFMMEWVMDSLDFPQRGKENRVFSQEELKGTWRRRATPQEERLPAMATFQIMVLFRQNASWQGNLAWRERELDAPFRSVLELICLIDSALSYWE